MTRIGRFHESAVNFHTAIHCFVYDVLFEQEAHLSQRVRATSLRVVGNFVLSLKVTLDHLKLHR